MTRLAVIRHGPTEWNAQGRMQGHSDLPLSATGRAVVAGWRLPAGIGGKDWIWLCSPLARARETAALLNPEAKVQPEPALCEMSWGAWEGRILAELRRAGGAETAALEARGLDFQPPGGESPRQVQARLAPLLARLAGAGGDFLAVTHKGVIRALYAQACGWDMTGRSPVKLCDACAHLFKLDADGRPRIERLNMELAA